MKNTRSYISIAVGLLWVLLGSSCLFVTVGLVFIGVGIVLYDSGGPSVSS